MRVLAGGAISWDRGNTGAFFSAVDGDKETEQEGQDVNETKQEKLQRLEETPESMLTPVEKEELNELKTDGIPGDNELDEDQRQMIKQLEYIEQSVRAHEMAHQAAGGNLVGAASYKYTMGPDYKLYITGGEVRMKLPVSGTPETMMKVYEQLRKAATAVSDSSGEDRGMAAMANQKVQEIKALMKKQKGKIAYQAQLKKKDTTLN